MSSGSSWAASLSFQTLIKNYVKIQSKVVSAVQDISKNTDTATPGKFLALQFQMAQVTQIGESISNLIQQVQAMIANSIRNQKG